MTWEEIKWHVTGIIKWWLHGIGETADTLFNNSKAITYLSVTITVMAVFYESYKTAMILGISTILFLIIQDLRSGRYVHYQRQTEKERLQKDNEQ